MHEVKGRRMIRVCRARRDARTASLASIFDRLNLVYEFVCAGTGLSAITRGDDMITVAPEPNARLDALQARLTGLAQRVADLTTENERLRSGNSPGMAEPQSRK
jgi:cell division protein FtsB